MHGSFPMLRSGITIILNYALSVRFTYVFLPSGV
jgi:hypothetical protein